MINLAITEHDDAGFVQIINQLLNATVQRYEPARYVSSVSTIGSITNGGISQASSIYN
jgi:hypothetical protein